MSICQKCDGHGHIHEFVFKKVSYQMTTHDRLSVVLGQFALVNDVLNSLGLNSRVYQDIGRNEAKVDLELSKCQECDAVETKR